LTPGGQKSRGIKEAKPTTPQHLRPLGLVKQAKQTDQQNQTEMANEF